MIIKLLDDPEFLPVLEKQVRILFKTFSTTNYPAAIPLDGVDY